MYKSLHFSPSSENVPLSDLSMKIEQQIPIKTDKRDVYWLYDNAIIAGKIRRHALECTPGLNCTENAAKVKVYGKLKSFRKQRREAFILIKDQKFIFKETEDGIYTFEGELDNISDVSKVRIRSYAHAERVARTG